MVWSLTKNEVVRNFVKSHEGDEGVWIVVPSHSMVDALSIALPKGAEADFKSYLEVVVIANAETPIIGIHVLDDRALFHGSILAVRNPLGFYDAALLKLRISDQNYSSESMKDVRSVRSIGGEPIGKWVTVGDFLTVVK